MKEQPLFSIIIPHYNIPDLLMRCLGSIPVHPDFQVIVVDDCSPNAETYLSTYPQLSRPYLEYYTTAQGGSAGRARNVALSHAQGRWLICLDADDLFTPEAESLLRREADNPADVLFFGYRSVLSDDLNTPAKRNLYQKLFVQYAKDHDDRPLRYQFEAMWGKVFRRSMVEEHQIRCDETRYSNDVTFSLLCGIYARQTAVFTEPLFLITSREDSLASAQVHHRKGSVAEREIRLLVTLRAQKLVDEHHIRFDTKKYEYTSYMFWNEHPCAFWRFYFQQFLHYPNTLLRIARYYLHSKHGEWVMQHKQ